MTDDLDDSENIEVEVVVEEEMTEEEMTEEEMTEEEMTEEEMTEEVTREEVTEEEITEEEITEVPLLGQNGVIIGREDVIELVICSEEDDDKLDEVAVVGALATITVSSVG